MSEILLSSTYMTPVSLYSRIVKADSVSLEAFEFYVKQTYRNRCYISTANGIMPLTVPIQRNGKMLMKDVLIDYKEDWQKLHYRAIESAYRSSPFFEYYEDDFRPFFENREKYLLDLNLKLNEKITELIGIKREITLSESYIDNFSPKADLRDHSPKKQSFTFNAKPYYQVFIQRFGFLPDLSIIDLLFNEGNNTYSILKGS